MLEEVWKPFAHANCQCNAVISAQNRVLAANPIPTDRAIKSVRRTAKVLARTIGYVERWTFDEVLSIYSGPKRTRYQNAIESLANKPLVKGDRYVTAFVKGEKLNPYTKENPDPRMIQYRGPRYGIVLATYLKPIEKKLLGIVVGTKDLPAMAKGLNSKERARLLERKWESFGQPVCVSLDCSRWDRHLHKDMLQIEHDFYKHLIGGSKELDWLLAGQLKNKCKVGPITKDWIVKYVVNGNRMSGDMNTALGNCLMMVLFVKTAIEQLKISDWDIMDDGDDCLLFLENKDLAIIEKELPNIFLTYGQELKIENVARNITSVQFCQTRYVNLSTGARMISDWRKILGCGTSGIRFWDNPRIVPDMLHAVGTCLFAGNFGVPIIQQYALRLIQLGSGKLPKCWKMMYDEQMKLARDTRMWESGIIYNEMPISMDDRYEFELTYGVRVERQLEIEDYLRRWNPDFTMYRKENVEWDHTWVDATSPDLVHIM